MHDSVSPYAHAALVLVSVCAPSLAQKNANPPQPSSSVTVRDITLPDGNGYELVLNRDILVTVDQCAINQPNSQILSLVPSVTGFGYSLGNGEVDVLIDDSSCSWGTPYTGPAFLGIAVNEDLTRDEVAFELAERTRVGTSYDVSLQALSYISSFSPDVADIEVGLSTSPDQFGTTIARATAQATTWGEIRATFTASIAARYLTVRPVTGTDSWVHIDAVSLVETPPATDGPFVLEVRVSGTEAIAAVVPILSPNWPLPPVDLLVRQLQPLGLELRVRRLP